MAAADFTRWFLALFFASVAAFYVVRITLAKRRTGASPVFSGKPGSSHFATHLSFRVFRAAILGVCIARLLWPPLDKYLITLDILWRPAIFILGDCLLLGGFASVVVIHFLMGNDWRSGTRANDRTHLITTGPFAFSRNPMMLGVMTAQLGLFLALPSVFTLLCLVVGIWAVNAQVRVEEQLLRKRFGAAYTAYTEQTPRWLRVPTGAGRSEPPHPGSLTAK